MVALAASEVSPLAVALIGGAGAFLGAVLGSSVQLLRDWRERIAVDRRRREDAEAAARDARRTARQEEYRQTLQLVYEVESAFAELEYRSAMSEPWENLDITMSPDAMIDRWKEVEREHLRQWDTVEALTGEPMFRRAATLDTVGSSGVRELFEQYRLTAAQIAGLGRMNAGVTPSPASSAFPERTPEGWPPKIVGMHHSLKSYVGVVRERAEGLRAAIRHELDLAD